MARGSLWRDLGWRLEAGAFDLFSALFRLMPVDTASAAGAGLLRLIGPLSPAHRTAARNIAIAFPAMEEPGRRALLRAQWDNVGRLFAEFPLTDRLTPASGRVEIVGGERLAAIAREHRAAVLISGHFSNWEIMAAAIVHLGVDCQITYRAANNPAIDRRIIEAPALWGQAAGAQGRRRIARDPGGHEGRAIGRLSQRPEVQRRGDCPFFGRPVQTAPGPTRMALRFDAPMIPMSVQRTRGARFRVVVHEPLEFPRTGDRVADIRAGVEAVNAFMEARVRERPAEWFWVHKRWPAAEYARS